MSVRLVGSVEPLPISTPDIGEAPLQPPDASAIQLQDAVAVPAGREAEQSTPDAAAMARSGHVPASSATASSATADRSVEVPPPSPTPMPRETPVAPTGGDTGVVTGLDHGPTPIDAIEPQVPPAAGNRGGTVTLHLVISAEGFVEKAEIVKSSPPGLFDAAALTAFVHARFSPGSKAGIPVRSEVTYELAFSPIGRGSEASGRGY